MSRPDRPLPEPFELALCSGCFALTGIQDGKEHRCSCQSQDEEWRTIHWAGHDMPRQYVMCHICVRKPLASGPRWSWYACDSCREVNQTVGEAFGGPGTQALPLGVHSIMNSHALRVSYRPNEPTSGFAEQLVAIVEVWDRLTAWQKDEGRRLAESRRILPDLRIPAVEWTTMFPASVGASADAFVRLVGTEIPDHPKLEDLQQERRAFKAWG